MWRKTSLAKSIKSNVRWDLCPSTKSISGHSRTAYFPSSIARKEQNQSTTVKRKLSPYQTCVLSVHEHIIMLCAASASGAALPPMIIIIHWSGQYKFGGPDDTLYARSSVAKMNVSSVLGFYPVNQSIDRLNASALLFSRLSMFQSLCSG